MLILVSLRLRSPNFAELSEWDACDRPLGLWAALWILRVILASSLAYWEYRRDRTLYDLVICFTLELSIDLPLVINQTLNMEIH